LTDEKVDLEAKLKATQCELDEVTQTVVGRTGNSDAIELISMRHECREAKLKIVEQEEELDDMAGNVEKLQKSITDLQMKAERMRCEHARELDAKEQEMDEQRALHQRRVSRQ
jgi:TolA-binding protein